MKQIYSKRLFLSLLFVLVGITQVLAWSNNYWAKLTANATPTGAGKVYVTDSKTAPTDKSSYQEKSGNFFYTHVEGKTGSDPGSAVVTIYAYALPSDGYAFQGWYDSETGGNQLGTDTQYKWTVTSEAGGKKAPANTPSQTVYARFYKFSKQTITFLSPTNGSYTASDGTTTISNSGSLTAESFTLKATPNNGYKILGWYSTTDGGKTKEYFSTEASVTDKKFGEAVSVGVDFVPTTTPIFIVKGSNTPYTDLNAADNAAGGCGTIVLISDGTLPEGTYTISAGNTLLIPYDDAYTVKTTKAEVTQTWTNIKAYKTLTLASGANITINNGAAICVGGKQFSTSNQMGSAGGPGSPTGSYGCIDMSNGGNITLQNGSNLYVWGFITGQNMDQGNNTTDVGTIEAQSGATVYEDIVIADWHGGNATLGMDSKKKYFPFNQYFIPNIEVPLTINYGATLNTVSDISAGSLTKNPYNVPVTFIAKSGGLFNMQSSSSTAKVWYDATTDEQHFEFTGNNTIEGISANVGGYVTVDASNYVMPVTSNFNIRIKSGTLTVPDDIALLPGSKVTLDEGVTATVNKGVNVYVYDLANWGLYAYNNYRKVYPFRPTKFKKYGQGDKDTKAEDVAKVTGLSDAQLIVNGNLTVNGAIYTTNAGANICSTNKGNIIFATTPAAASSTYQYVHGGNPAEVKIPVTAAQLHNASDALNDYTATTGSAANTTFTYKNHVWTSEAEPTFELANNKLTLTKAYPVTADEVKTNATGKSYHSVDLINANGPLDAKAVRDNVVTKDEQKNVLLYLSKNDAGTNIKNIEADNVVVKDSKGAYTAANLVITDKQPIDVPTAFTATNVSYSRANTKNSGDKQWGTICLPFALKSGNGIQYYELSEIDGNTMRVTEVTEVPANQPAIYSVASNTETIAITSKGASIAATSDGKYPLTGGKLVLYGVQTAPQILEANSTSSSYYYIAQNKFWQPTKNAVTVSPQRAYFVSDGNTTAKVLSIVEDGETTGISSAETSEPTIIGIYTVGGVKTDNLEKGINIVRMSDGTTKKIILK